MGSLLRVALARLRFVPFIPFSSVTNGERHLRREIDIKLVLSTADRYDPPLSVLNIVLTSLSLAISCGTAAEYARNISLRFV